MKRVTQQLKTRSRRDSNGNRATRVPAQTTGFARLDAWLAGRGWKAFDFQLEAMEAYRRGESGLVHAQTGTGKTLAVWLGPLSEALADATPTAKARVGPGRLRLLWITPLRALASDTVASLREPLTELAIPWRVEARTGDTPSHRKQRQRENWPEVLVITPESLSLLLSHPETEGDFASLEGVVVDEWHELMGSKRGTQTELALARLRQWRPNLRIWGLSATLGNLGEALDALLGDHPKPRRIVRGTLPKPMEIRTLLPEAMDRFPWAGHLGLKLLPDVIRALEEANTSLVFTNTRSQTEIWFRALYEAKPEWGNLLGIHHGSMDRKSRESVEQRLKEGKLRAVVCTSSLDLGVDFSPVDQVVQIGGPKGIARLMQRAGRSGHQPGRVSRVICVPTHALELVEYAAVRRALSLGEIESRSVLDSPLDVLVQHVVTLSMGSQPTPEELLAEIRTTRAYRDLTDLEFGWVLEFVIHGGESLRAYPEYAKVTMEQGRLKISSPAVAQLHRLSIGTITSDHAVAVKFANGAHLGTVEESFVARLKPGSRFSFAGRVLELVRVRQMTATVRPSRKAQGAVPSWQGGRSPLSSQLADAVRRELDAARAGVFEGLEMERMREILTVQSAWSRIPSLDEILIETTVTREGRHWFLFPFGGRLVHEGMAALLAYRLSRERALTVTVAVNDYGLELLPSTETEFSEDEWRKALSPENLVEDLLACLNSTELARRQFREGARIAGLVFQGFPGAHKQARHLQASSSLFYEVFTKYEPEHLLLRQARREVLERELQFQRMQALFARLASQTLRIERTERLTPMAFPLWAEMIRAQVSSESWEQRVRRMVGILEEVSPVSPAPTH